MAKDSFYFQHDYNARNDEKILDLRSEYGAEGYGIFWMIVETMAENENGGVTSSFIGGLSLGFGVAKSRLSEIIEYCIKVGLFYEKDGFYFSKRLLTYKEFRKQMAEYGKLGADKRWGGHRGANGKSNANNRIENNRIKKGVYFSDDGLNVIFDDKSIQALDEGELKMKQFGELRPRDITKK